MLIRVVFLFVSSFFLLAGVYASSPSEVVKEANEALATGQTVRAIQLYQRVHEAGWTSADMYFNWGNAYLALDSFPQALLQFERARKWKPGHREATYNLNWLRREMELSENPPSVFFALRIWNGVGGVFRPAVWTWLGIISCWAMSVGIIIWMITKASRRRKRGFLLGMAMLPLTILFWLMGYQQTQRLQQSRSAIILSTSEVYSAPDTGSAPAATLLAGEKIWIEDQIGTLLKVSQGDAVLGWMEESILERI